MHRRQMRMMRSYIYADESGNFDFSNQAGASRYFILTSVVVADHAIESDLLELRRELAWEGEPLAGGFHATNDKRHVRERVFALLGQHEFRIDATILEKRKADPRVRPTPAFFYGFAWYYHLTGLIPALAPTSDELQIIAASVADTAMRTDFHSAVGAIQSGVAPASVLNATMWTASSSALLQVADYCAWAVQRKWERSDTRAYDLMKEKVASEFEVFREGTTYYY